MAVRMTHPDLPGTEISVAASAVPFHREARWEEVPGQDEHGEVWPLEAQRFGGQTVVRLRHPDLEQEIEVAESAVPFHRERGWQLADQVEAEALEGRKVAELRELAKERGISPIPSTKAELVEALHESPDVAGEPAPSEEDEG
jgi:hypothetical protein